MTEERHREGWEKAAMEYKEECARLRLQMIALVAERDGWRYRAEASVGLAKTVLEHERDVKAIKAALGDLSTGDVVRDVETLMRSFHLVTESVARLEREREDAVDREIERTTARRCRVCGKPGHDECGYIGRR